jgi:hypothetical protein
MHKQGLCIGPVSTLHHFRSVTPDKSVDTYNLHLIVSSSSLYSHPLCCLQCLVAQPTCRDTDLTAPGNQKYNCPAGSTYNMDAGSDTNLGDQTCCKVSAACRSQHARLASCRRLSQWQLQHSLIEP